MARIVGDYTATTWGDFLVLPGNTVDDEPLSPEDIDISTDLAGVRLQVPFLTAAMRSVTGRDLALAAGKRGMMAVAPRGLIERKEVEIIKHVKKSAVPEGEIESEYKPTTAHYDDTLGKVLEIVRQTGNSNIPIVTTKYDFKGMFHYIPSNHDNKDPSTPIKKVMRSYRKRCDGKWTCTTDMSDKHIKEYLQENDLRLVPVLDDVGRLDRLVFLQKFDAYKIGGAIDTQQGWEKRAEKLIEAGADMIFIDTSDAHKRFSRDVVENYKKLFSEGPPICAGNVVTPEGFMYLVDAGADAVKLGMGPGSICSTNDVLGVGSAPFYSLVKVVEKRDEKAGSGDRYIPIIADGGIENTGDIAIALTHADAIMGGNIFGCFLESAGECMDRRGKIYPKGELGENDIVAKKMFGEGSPESRQTSGNMDRYATPTSKNGMATFQGVSGWVEYKGRFKPGIHAYTMALQDTLYHTGTPDLKTYRKEAVLTRLSERAKRISSPHGIEVIKS